MEGTMSGHIFWILETAVNGLRHTAGSLWLEAGLSLATVSRRLGHASVKTTERIYIHRFREALDQSALTMDELLPA
jgi:integrase